MTNAPKKKGTAFESAVVRYLREQTHDDQIERRALHGSKDCGDIYGIYAHGNKGIAECKAVKNWGPALLNQWRDQTIAERGNADADFAVLVVKVPQAPIAECIVHMTLRDLFRVGRGHFGVAHYNQACDEMWVRMTLDEFTDLLLAPMWPVYKAAEVADD